MFAEKAEKLISSDCVAAVFGGWTSSSRKAMLPVFEAKDSLLFYPVQYEGLEASPNIFYTGATTNQQILPGMDYLKEQGKSKIFLVGSDYVFPRTANKEIIAWAGANDVEIVGEEYAPLGHTDFATIVNKLKGSGADAVFNTLNGDSNVAFFKEYKNVGLSADTLPGRLGVHRRGGGRWHRHRQHRRPAHRLELLPDGRQPREHDVRRGVQGQVRRRPRDVRPDGGRVHVALPLEGDGREGRVVRRRGRPGGGRRRRRSTPPRARSP